MSPLIFVLIRKPADVYKHVLMGRKPDILKVVFLRGPNFSFEILRKIKCKNFTSNPLICVKQEEEKTVKEVKMHIFLVCACKYQDFAQNQKKFAQSHGRETVTFRNSVLNII